MVISHKYRYLFVELPHTGSTAIQEELCELYDGIPIMYKHACYREFLDIATEEEKMYFMFSGIRNPLDEAVSTYFKYKTNHKGRYTNPEKHKDKREYLSRRRVYDFVQDTGVDFAAYLKGLYRYPYDNTGRLSHNKFDFIIRFENLQDDFAQVLELLGIEQKRSLPVVNKTGEKRQHFLSYYTPDTYEHARWIFGPFMREWGYEFPPEWGDYSVPLSSQITYKLLGVFRDVYWGWLKGRSSFSARLTRKAMLNARKYVKRLFFR